jgi:hypothetical protein
MKCLCTGMPTFLWSGRGVSGQEEKYLRVIGLDDVLKEYEVLMAAPR